MTNELIVSLIDSGKLADSLSSILASNSAVAVSNLFSKQLLAGLPISYQSLAITGRVSLPEHPVPLSLMHNYTKIESEHFTLSGCTFSRSLAGTLLKGETPYACAAQELIKSLLLVQQYVPLAFYGATAGAVYIENYSIDYDDRYPLGLFELSLRSYSLQELWVQKVGAGDVQFVEVPSTKIDVAKVEGL